MLILVSQEKLSHLHELQSKALFFANEAYHTRQAAMHVVLNQQLNLKIALPREDYLISINEQIGFTMEQVSTKKGVGLSLWKSAKYVDRVSNAIDEIKKITGDLSDIFEPQTLSNIEAVKATSTELVKIKKGEGKYYNLDDNAKAVQAIEVGQGYPFNTDTIEAIRQGLLHFNIEVNTQLRKAKPEQYNSSPSELNQWPQADEQDLQEFYQPIEPEDEISTSDNLEDGTPVSITDWDLEEIA